MTQIQNLADKVKARLTEETLSVLFEDDDAFNEALQTVVREALTQPRRVPNGPYNYSNADSPVIEAARDAASILARQIVDSLLDDDAMRRKLVETMILALPAAMEATWRDTYRRYGTGFGQGIADPSGQLLSRQQRTQRKEGDLSDVQRI